MGWFKDKIVDWLDLETVQIKKPLAPDCIDVVGHHWEPWELDKSGQGLFGLQFISNRRRCMACGLTQDFPIQFDVPREVSEKVS